jgi:hypothetical protein
MLRLLSSPVHLLLLSITTRGPGLYLHTWKLLTILPQLPPLTTEKMVDSTLGSLGRGQRAASTVNLIDWAEDHHDHHEAELECNIMTGDIISKGIHSEWYTKCLVHILLSAWWDSERRGGMHIQENTLPLNLILNPSTAL